MDFGKQIRPLLEKYCFDCHGEQKQKAQVRVDNLNPDMIGGSDAGAWNHVLDMIQSGDMPPGKAAQPEDKERRLLVAWLTTSLKKAAEAKKTSHRSVIRRLNKEQYSYTLQDLLGVSVDFGRLLPDDGKSEMGFRNNGEVLQASPLHIEYYQTIAREALNQAIVIGEAPEPTWYRVRFGKGIGKGKVAGRTGGYQSVPLNPEDFTIEILDAQGQPKVGADADQQAALDAIKRRISIGLRGSSQSRFRSVEDGIILYSALPHKEKVPKSWQGPSPNLKLEMQRCFPETGDFLFRVTASRGYLVDSQERLLIEIEDPTPLAAYDSVSEKLVVAPEAKIFAATESQNRKNLILQENRLLAEDLPKECSAEFSLQLQEAGYFQFDLVHPPASPDAMPSVRLHLQNLHLDQRLEIAEAEQKQPQLTTALGAAYIPAGKHKLRVGGPFFVGFSHLILTPVSEDHPSVAPLTAKSEALAEQVAKLTPSLRAYAGTRTDDGMDYASFGLSQVVEAPLGKAQTYTFRGRLENLPIPEPESGDTEILSGFLLLGIWNHHLVKSSKEPGPPILVQGLEFQAPYHESWPPASHRSIFFDSPQRQDLPTYTRQVVTAFMEKAFRRQVQKREVDRYMEFWQEIRHDYEHYEQGVREILVAILCSPHFLFMVEPSPEGQGKAPLPQEALATRLAYFLWNSPPDGILRNLARSGALAEELESQVDRMLEDPKAWRFVRSFASQWLRLDRHALMTVNVDLYPQYTRFVKQDMAEETYHFLHQLLQRDLSIYQMIDSDFAMLNQNLAEFYGIEGVKGNQFRPVAIRPEQGRGGLLSQGAFLTGHSDGSQAHPIKRAVWLKEKILGDPPPPPPPNVPSLDPETPGFEKLTLKEQLEAHRDHPSCFDCHRGLDPYGIVFERYNAVGLLQNERKGRPVDTATVLPDGTPIQGVMEMKSYLLHQGSDAFAGSVIEHLFAYALGRDIHFSDEEELQQILERVRSEDYKMRSVIRAIVTSPSFTHR